MSETSFFEKIIQLEKELEKEKSYSSSLLASNDYLNSILSLPISSMNGNEDHKYIAELENENEKLKIEIKELVQKEKEQLLHQISFEEEKKFEIKEENICENDYLELKHQLNIQKIQNEQLKNEFLSLKYLNNFVYQGAKRLISR